MPAKNETGVVIESGASDWQIFQQDRKGGAQVRLAGRWSTANPFREAVVRVRVLNEDTFDLASSDLDWLSATTRRDGTWSIKLRLPVGGLYRLETILQVDGGPIEWGTRGDFVHHLGVGDVWVITGQSNAAGYGKTPVQDGPELGIHMFHACGRWQLATHPLGDSTNTQYPPNREGANASHSPWLAFARKLRQHLGYPIGLIPASLGGSPMAAWDRKVNGVLFRNLLDYVRDAGGAVRGVVWYQGESDAGAEQRAVYAECFSRFVADLCQSFRDPKLPVITAQLNRYIGEPETAACHENWEQMREVQRQIARDLPNVFIISLFDAMLSDGIHNSSLGNLLIGERMANVALGAVHGLPVAWQHPDCKRAVLTDAQTVDLDFDHIRGRLHFECNLKQEFPFAVRDAAGEVPIAGWALPSPTRFRIRLERPVQGAVRVIGAPGSNPSTAIPIDISGYRPMLGFIEPVRRQRKPR